MIKYDGLLKQKDQSNNCGSVDVEISKWHILSTNSKHLNGYTKRWCTKYKILLTSCDISVWLRESRFQTNAKSNVKIKFTGLLFSERVVSRCLWWRSHRCLGLELWTFYLFRLMFLVYLSQGLHAPSFYTCLTLRRLFSGESSWIVDGTLWCVKWRRMTRSYLLCCLVGVECNVTILFSLIHQYIYHWINTSIHKI